MKKVFLFASLALVVLGLGIASCDKQEEQKPEEQKPEEPKQEATSLEVSVISAGQVVSGATVTLFTSENDWNGGTNVKFTGTTDAQGKAKFDNVGAVKYWIRASKGCETVNTQGTYSVSVSANKLSSVTVTLRSTGTIVINNTSNNSYFVYLDNVLMSTIQKGGQLTLTNVPTGERAIKVVQLVGSVTETYTRTVTCGSTTTITLEEPVTSLEVSVVQAGQAVAGATVQLFTSSTDFYNGTNAEFTGTTNAQGKVKFDNLNVTSFKLYWIQASKGCAEAGSSVTVIAGVSNSVTVTLLSLSTIVLQSTSNNPYEVFLDDVSQGIVQGKGKLTLINVPIGERVIRVEQQSGYLFYPTIETYTRTLTCGSTVTIIFPQS